MIKLPPLWFIIVLSIMLILALTAFIFRRTIYDFANISPLATGEVIPNIYAVKTGSVNFYLIKGDTGYILIDAGGSIEQADRALKDLKILPDDIVAIFLTHSDSDHTASIPLFSNAKLYIHELEVQMIDGTTKRNSRRSNSLDAGFSVLKDNDKVEMDGITVLGIATPGHTPGSMSFMLNDKYLFTGDSMALINGKVSLFISVYNMDEKIQSESLKKLSDVGAKYIFTAHHGYSDNPAYVFENSIYFTGE